MHDNSLLTKVWICILFAVHHDWPNLQFKSKLHCQSKNLNVCKKFECSKYINCSKPKSKKENKNPSFIEAHENSNWFLQKRLETESLWCHIVDWYFVSRLLGCLQFWVFVCLFCANVNWQTWWTVYLICSKMPWNRCTMVFFVNMVCVCIFFMLIGFHHNLLSGIGEIACALWYSLHICYKSNDWFLKLILFRSSCDYGQL